MLRPEEPRARLPGYRRLHRVFFAACILIGPIAAVMWFSLCPVYGDAGCPDQGKAFVYAAFQDANPALIQLFLLVNLVFPYFFPLSYVGLGLVAMRRSPWLATFGMAFGFAGSIPATLFADQSFMLYDMARLGHADLFAALEKSYYSNWQVLDVFAVAWLFGHLLGYVLLGIALIRGQLVPVWAGGVIVAAAPVMGPVAYATNVGWIQVAGFAMVLVGSVPIALAMLKGRHDEEPSKSQQPPESISAD